MILHEPHFFASLGPTAYELAETPERQSAKPYNVAAGQRADGGRPAGCDVQRSLKVRLQFHPARSCHGGRSQIRATGYECDLLSLACLIALVLCGSGPFSFEGVFPRSIDSASADWSLSPAVVPRRRS